VPSATSPATQKPKSRFGCSSVFAFLIVAGGAAITWLIAR
jgi:hypothetical protein